MSEGGEIHRSRVAQAAGPEGDNPGSTTTGSKQKPRNTGLLLTEHWAIYSRNSDSVVSTPEPFLLHPTPMQLVLRQETPKNALKVAPAGFGVP